MHFCVLFARIIELVAGLYVSLAKMWRLLHIF